MPLRTQAEVRAAAQSALTAEDRPTALRWQRAPAASNKDRRVQNSSTSVRDRQTGLAVAELTSG